MTYFSFQNVQAILRHFRPSLYAAPELTDPYACLTRNRSFERSGPWASNTYITPRQFLCIKEHQLPKYS